MVRRRLTRSVLTRVIRRAGATRAVRVTGAAHAAHVRLGRSTVPRPASGPFPCATGIRARLLPGTVRTAGSGRAMKLVRLLLGLVLGAVWCWAALRLALTPERAGLLEGTVVAGGWGLSLLPVHVASPPPARSRVVRTVVRGVARARRRRRSVARSGLSSGRR